MIQEAHDDARRTLYAPLSAAEARGPAASGAELVVPDEPAGFPRGMQDGIVGKGKKPPQRRRAE
jgi:hypothetical protein